MVNGPTSEVESTENHEPTAAAPEVVDVAASTREVAQASTDASGPGEPQPSETPSAEESSVATQSVETSSPETPSTEVQPSEAQSSEQQQGAPEPQLLLPLAE